MVDDLPQDERLAFAMRSKAGPQVRRRPRRRRREQMAGAPDAGAGRGCAHRPANRCRAGDGRRPGRCAVPDPACRPEQGRLSAARGDRRGDLQQSRSQRAHRCGRLLRAAGRPAADDGRPRSAGAQEIRSAARTASWRPARPAIAPRPRRSGPRSARISPTSARSSIARGLIEAIVSPSAAIAFGFGAELFVTQTGRDDRSGFSSPRRNDLDSRRLRPGANDRGRRSRWRGFR